MHKTKHYPHMQIELTTNEANEIKLTLLIELKNPETPSHRRYIIECILAKL